MNKTELARVLLKVAKGYSFFAAGLSFALGEFTIVIFLFIVIFIIGFYMDRLEEQKREAEE